MQAILQFLLFTGILLFSNILSSAYHTSIDLTEEKRFTLTKPTREMLRSLKDRIYINVLLDGSFPAGFKRLQSATREMLDDFRFQSGYIDYAFEDPAAGTVEQVNERRKALAEEGIVPMNLRIAEQGESSQKLIYPVAVIHYGSRRLVVKLLENESASLSPEMVINNSVSLLEYKFANGIQKILTAARPIILYTTGHGELTPLQTSDIDRNLRQYYDTDRINLDSAIQIKPDACALLIVAKPRSLFSEKDKFKIDQYIMSGGKVMWLIDRLGAGLDSLGQTGRTIPIDYPLAIEDMLFKYGIRIQPDLVMDLECTKIPLRVGQMGNAPQLELFDWYYHLAVQAKSRHPIVKNLDRIEMDFCSSMDTLRTKTPIKKTVLLSSSRYSRLVFSPVELNFEILRYSPDPSKFNKGSQILGVLLEGSFTSNYENRVSQEMLAGLQQIGLAFKSTGVATRMLVVSDGDITANYVRDSEKRQWLPLGFNRFENITYANKDFMMNAIEYLVNPAGVIAARTKEVKLRLIDTVRVQEERLYWQMINIGSPLLLLVLFGAAYSYTRRRRYIG
jgi:ABC-2 type transport system permease protein